jgi:hypothetical protein
VVPLPRPVLMASVETHPDLAFGEVTLL